MSEKYKRIEIRDGKGRWGRLDFAIFLNRDDAKQIKKYYKANPKSAPEWLPLIDRLSNNHDLGWWRPSRFQQSSRSEEVPLNLTLDPASMGWEAMQALRAFKADIMDWIENGPVNTEWRQTILYHREWERERGKKSADPTPFEGVGILDKIESEKISIQDGDAQKTIETQCFAIYLNDDAYLTPQKNRNTLDRAALYSSKEDAERVIKEHGIDGAQVAVLNVRVDSFSLPHKIGPVAARAMAEREAAQLNQQTPATPRAKPRSNRL